MNSKDVIQLKAINLFSRVIKSGGLMLFIIYLIIFIMLLYGFVIFNFNITILSFLFLFIALSFFIKSFYYCRFYIYHISFDEEKVFFFYYKYNQKKTLIIPKHDLKIRVYPATTIKAGIQYKMVIKNQKNIHVIQNEIIEWDITKFNDVLASFEGVIPRIQWQRPIQTKKDSIR